MLKSCPFVQKICLWVRKVPESVGRSDRSMPARIIQFSCFLEERHRLRLVGAARVTAVELLKSIIQEHAPEDIWRDSPLIGYRMLGNTPEIGEEFIRRYLAQHGIDTGNGNRASPTDLRSEQFVSRLKASLGATGTFQFNHVRLDRMYDYLLCRMLFSICGAKAP